MKTLNDFWTVRGKIVLRATLAWGNPKSSLRANTNNTKKVVILSPPAVQPGAPPRNICKI